MKTGNIRKKGKKRASSLVNKLQGATAAARRRAFKQKLPVAVFENGKVYLVYPDKTKVEATREMLENLTAK